MINWNPDIAVRPPVAGYPLVLGRKSDPEDAADAADFERVLQQTIPAAPANYAGVDAEEGFSFLGFIKAVIDVINPLQHIPVVSAIYRHITGDEISPVARMVGDGIYGGPIGAAVAVADIVYENATGKDVGATVIASLTGNGTTNESGPVPPTSPALQAKGSAPTYLPLTALKVDSTIALQSQEAPADPVRRTGQPELIALPVEKVTAEMLPGSVPAAVSKDMIAYKMMEALDKYAAMKRPPQASVVSAAY